VNGDGVADAVIGAPGTLGISGNPGHVYVFDLVAPLPARAFAHDAHRALPLTERGAPHCLRVEPVGSAFAIEEVDPGSVRLRAEGGEVSAIAPRPEKRLAVGDRDGNGVGEVAFCFEREDLRRLFSFVRGRREVAASLDGALVTGEPFAANVSLTVVGAAPPAPAEATLAPNPLNPSATLRLRLDEPGLVEVALYDVRGRRVRTVAPRAWMSAGEHRLGIDGRDDAGRSLASGVYFYRVRTSREELGGRFVVAK
jgi:hypothetical protein